LTGRRERFPLNVHSDIPLLVNLQREIINTVLPVGLNLDIEHVACALGKIRSVYRTKGQCRVLLFLIKTFTELDFFSLVFYA